MPSQIGLYAAYANMIPPSCATAVREMLGTVLHCSPRPPHLGIPAKDFFSRPFSTIPRFVLGAACTLFLGHGSQAIDRVLRTQQTMLITRNNVAVGFLAYNLSALMAVDSGDTTGIHLSDMCLCTKKTPSREFRQIFGHPLSWELYACVIKHFRDQHHLGPLDLMIDWSPSDSHDMDRAIDHLIQKGQDGKFHVVTDLLSVTISGFPEPTIPMITQVRYIKQGLCSRHVEKVVTR